jgi:acetate kinase
VRVLVVNAGSSSLKVSLVDGEQAVAAATLDPGDDDALREQLARMPGPEAVGHRIVHGGRRYREATLITPEVEAALHELAALAPLHQEKSLRALDQVRTVLGSAVPEVACFDTAFHAGLPDEAATYAVPAAWRERWELRRFGFHGLAHSYALREATARLGAVPERMVSCHLGSGASLCAIAGGRSVDTTMGFTPLEGLVMATRSGSVDPRLLLWLEEHVGIPPSELASTLEHRSGLLGLTGMADMRSILRAERDGDQAARAAIEVYLHRLRSAIAAMAAAMDGLDGLVFTGGVGEGSSAIRARAAERLRFLDVSLDTEANDALEPDADIGAAGAAVRAFVIRAREDLEIARQVRTVLVEGP